MKLCSIFSLVACAACGDDHTPLSFVASGDQIIATGVIDSTSLDLFEDIISDHPNAKTLVLQNIGGSVDDEANVKFARVVRDLGLSTRVPEKGLVASGGTDLFLAGVNRVLDAGACIGVHSWAADDFTATQLHRSDPEHDRYLSYYHDIGINEAFYWFTLDAAPADGMHWMNAQEVSQFNVSTEKTNRLGTSAICDDR